MHFVLLRSIGWAVINFVYTQSSCQIFYPIIPIKTFLIYKYRCICYWRDVLRVLAIHRRNYVTSFRGSFSFFFVCQSLWKSHRHIYIYTCCVNNMYFWSPKIIKHLPFRVWFLSRLRFKKSSYSIVCWLVDLFMTNSKVSNS